jgi:hypothetical protein
LKNREFESVENGTQQKMVVSIKILPPISMKQVKKAFKVQLKELSMFGKSGRVRKAIWFAAASVIFAGCGPSEEIQQQLAQLEVVTAQQDSLLEAVAEYAEVMSEISAELAAVELEGQELRVAVESPVAASRDSILGKIRLLDDRLQQSEQRLRQTRWRVSQLNQLSDSLRNTLESTIANYEGVLATHRESIASLTDQITELEAETDRLAANVEELEDDLDEASTVYYAISTKDELLERGIIEKKGGARVLFIFGKSGETLVPATNLDPADFTAIDSREVSEIPVPNPDAAYMIVSHHNPAYLENTPDEDGMIYGPLRITAPADFWSASPFLILVED